MHITQEAWSYIFINSIREIGPARFKFLIDRFETAHQAIQAGPEGWSDVLSMDNAGLKSLQAGFADAKRLADQESDYLQKSNIRLVMWSSPDYPALLREISTPPPLLYVKGNGSLGSQPSVALVGSRRPSFYGEKVAARLAMELAEVGVTTVSGLARGIDTHVHQGSLDANGKTLAVVGCGLSFIYPPENKRLAERIEAAGALISEFPISTKPHPANFPRRNRIIAGLSLGIVVVEGGIHSGSLITARLAAEEGREVFAVPGPISSPMSAAPHFLLRQGAAMVESVEDILENLRLSVQSGPREEPLKESLRHGMPVLYEDILTMIGDIAIPRETIAQKLQKDIAEVASLLMEMELQGWVRALPGGLIVKN